MNFTQNTPGYAGVPSTGNAMSNVSIPAIIMNIGETFVPGLGLANHIASTYFQIDLTYHIVLAFGSLAILTGLSYVWSCVWYWISPYLTCSAEIRCDDPVYNYLMYWVTKQNFSSRTTRFVASIRTSSPYIWEEDGGEDEMQNDNQEAPEDGASSNWHKMKTVNFTPSQGTHRFWFRGRPFTFARYKNDNQGFWRTSAETLYVSTIGRDTQLIKDLLQEAQLSYHERDGNKTVIYRGMKPPGGSAEELDWTRCLSRPPRPMSTVVLDDAQKSDVVADMKEYLSAHTRKWYSNRGLPYRRGYLFHGPPGTGKTSLCFALAGLLNLRIYVVSLNSKSVTEDSLAKLFSDLPWRCIILLEDIDSAGITTKREVKEIKDDSDKRDESKEKSDSKKDPAEGSNSTNPQGITLSAFLNIIDGVASSEGRILVMTTNHIEKLDPAILRPGRVDRTIRFHYTDRGMTRGIFKAIYCTSDSKGSNSANDNKIVKDYVHVKKHSRSSSETSTKSNIALISGALTPPPTPGLGHKGFSLHDSSEDEVDNMADEFASKMPLDEFTPAEIQGFLLRHKHDPRAAVKGVDGFVESIREEKRVQREGIAKA